MIRKIRRRIQPEASGRASEPSRIRKTAAVLPLIGALASGCAAVLTRPVVAPDPSSVIAHADPERDWFSLGINITDATVYANFEPIVQELAGEAPVPASRVTLVSDERLRAICSPDAGGCYRRAQQDIFIGETVFEPGASHHRSRRGHCRMQSSSSLTRNHRLGVWVHEQAHHFDRHLGTNLRDRWINEIEAESLIFYFAEHMARHYDMRLGVDMIHVKLYRQLLRSITWDAEAATERAQERLALMDTGDDSVNFTYLGNIGLAALLSTRQLSFGELWYFVHTHSHDEVEMLARGNLGNLAEGHELANSMMNTLIDFEMDISHSFDASSIRDFRIEDDVAAMPVYISYGDPEADHGFGWTEGFYIFRFTSRPRGDDMEWRLNVVDTRMPFGIYLFTIIVYRDADGTTRLELQGPDDLEQTQSLLIPDITRNRAIVIAGANPLDLTFCVTRRRQVSVDAEEYLDMVGNVADELRASLERSETDASLQYLMYFDEQLSSMFGE